MTTSVLVVEDNTDLRRLIRHVLEDAGYEVAEAGNGREAAEIQRARPTDVLITDIFMPERDGLETIDEFRKIFPQTRIIAISGAHSSGADYLYAARAFGADATLAKPFEPQALLEMLKELGS